MPRGIKATLPTTDTPIEDIPALEFATIGAPDEQGRWKIALPDLPPQAAVWIRNKTSAHFIFELRGEEPIFLGPLDEVPLPKPDTWLIAPKFREAITNNFIEVYRRTSELALPKEPPARLMVEERYRNTVAQFCYGQVEDAIELMEIEPRLGSGESEILDIDFLTKTWNVVLGRALWTLKELRSCGREVDERRISALEGRMAWIEEQRIEMKAALF